MRFFRKPKKVVTPTEVTELRKETHAAATEATKQLKKINKVMSNGITINIYHAAGGKRGR